MNDATITDRNKEFNRILKEWQDFADVPLRKVIRHLYVNYHYSQEQIAEITEYDKAVISRKYSRKDLV